MPLILVVLKNDPYPSPRKGVLRFEEYLSLSLMATSELRMNL